MNFRSLPAIIAIFLPLMTFPDYSATLENGRDLLCISGEAEVWFNYSFNPVQSDTSNLYKLSFIVERSGDAPDPMGSGGSETGTADVLEGNATVSVYLLSSNVRDIATPPTAPSANTTWPNWQWVLEFNESGTTEEVNLEIMMNGSCDAIYLEMTNDWENCSQNKYSRIFKPEAFCIQKCPWITL